MNSVATEAMKNVEGFEYAMQLTRWLLLPLGLWTSKYALYQRVLRPAAIATCIAIMIFVIVPFWMLEFVDTQNIRKRIKRFAQHSFSFMNLFKYVAMIGKHGEVVSCVRGMLVDWQELATPSERKIMLDNARTGRLLTTMYVAFMYSSGMLFIAVLPLIRGPVMHGNVSFKPLPYPGYFPFFNLNIRPLYEYVFATQLIFGLIRYTVTCGVYSFIVLGVMHICSQISITSTKLDRLVNNFDIKLLGKIVTQHLRFLKFASKLEDIFNKICLVEFVGSTCIICLVGYNIIMEYEQRDAFATFTYFLLLFTFIFNIFILCYIGEILTEQCQCIGTTAYKTHWYHLSSKEAQNMVMLVTTTQRPVVLTAGKMVNLSLQSFTNVIKASASYLNMLRTVIANSN